MPDDRDEVARLQAELARVQALHATAASENARLRGELTEAREQQTATAEILRTIASSPTDLQRVLNTVARNAASVCGSEDALIRLVDGDFYTSVAVFGPLEGALGGRFPIDRSTPSGRVIVDRETFRIEDMLAVADVEFPERAELYRTIGYRSAVCVPMLHEGMVLGTIAIRRMEVRPFTDQEVALLESFADQAVIVIENARLFTELQESNRQVTKALEQQTATAEILRVIASSQAELEPVFEAVAERAYRLCHASSSRLYLVDGDVHRIVMSAAESDEAIGLLAGFPRRGIGRVGPLSRQGMTGRTILDRRVLHLPDCESEEVIAEFPLSPTGPGFARSRVHVPLLRDGEAIGVISVARMEYAPFSENEIALLEAFADQAVIAIENARLFQELQESNRQATEALEQQTATADILRTIASTPTDLQRVLDAVSQTAHQLCGAQLAVLHLPEGNVLRPKARGYASDEIFDQSTPPVGPTLDVSGLQAVSGRAFLTGSTVHVPDIEAVAEEFSESVKSGRMRGWRASVAAPLIHGGQTLGVLSMYAVEPRSFTDRQIAFLESFASQAAIAVANARLFQELEQRTTQLTDALEQQTATADILGIVASTPSDVQPVLDAVVARAREMTNSSRGALSLRDGDLAMARAWSGEVRGSSAPHEVVPIQAKRPAATAIREGRTIHIPDLSDPSLPALYPDNMPDRWTPVARLFVPLMRDGESIGLLQVARNEPRAYTPQDITLLETFAAQAVIAIENARLFQALQESNRQATEALEQQTAMAEVLQVIASSPTDLDIVLETIVKSVARLGQTDAVAFFRVDGDECERMVNSRRDMPGVLLTDIPTGTRELISRDSWVGRAILDRQTLRHDDVEVVIDQEYPRTAASYRKRLERQGDSAYRVRSLLVIPLLSEGIAIGALVVSRGEVRPFTDGEIALLETFADQAVIAIENARLFQALQESNRQATEALEQQTAMAEVLRVIASSPTDVQPVLDAVASSVLRLSRSGQAQINLREGDVGRIVAEARAETNRGGGYEIGTLLDLTIHMPGIVAMRESRTVHIRDRSTEAFRAEYPLANSGVSTTLHVPLMREGQAIGVITVRRDVADPYTAHEISLVETFADQAVIAIENARLFQELEQRTSELTEALEQQTAQAEVLRVIAASPSDLTPVLSALAETAGRLCGTNDVVIHRIDGDWLVVAASTGPFRARGLGDRRRVARDSVAGRAIVDGRTVHVHDILAESDQEYGSAKAFQAVLGYRTLLATPLLRSGVPIGSILLGHNEVHPFTEKQIALLQTFADQAVIAIENARLFDELEQRTAQLTRSVDELHVLGEVGQAVSSSLDLQTVLSTIVGNATRLAGADGGIVYEYDDDADVFELRAGDQLTEDLAAALQTARMRLGEGVVGRAALMRAPLQVEDIEQQPDLLVPAVLDQLLTADLHSVLAVPLLREDRVLGGLVLSRRTPGAFPDEVVTLLQTLATQSALAIHNARLYQTLEAQGQALSEASQHKSQFLANMSHELRTPLNAVIGYSEMLHEELSDLGQEALVPDVEKITAAGRHLLGLINDILDLSKIEAGKMDLFLESVDVAALLHDVATTVEPLIARNGNQLELHIAPDTGSMYADATKLRQIFFNLLGNAAKFTEHGTIALRVERSQDEPEASLGLLPSPAHGRGGQSVGGGGYLTFTVSDNGIGMSDEQLDRLFQAFTQAEASTTRRFGGTGLGLTLVRHFAEMMEGDVQVTSAVGAGSTFVVRLPAIVTSLEQRVRERHADGASGGHHPALFGSPLSGDSGEPFVLIVDDDAASRELLRRYLEADGIRVVEAAGGVEGIRLARQLQPALITLDVLMPGLDGWAVLGMLKDDPATADIPVILLTILDDRDLGYALGAADYLTKPVERERLLRAVCKHVGRPAQGAARRALVVEDDPATREMLGRLLQREGWAVDEAENGRIGLERVAAGPPDLILLDLMMPELDGFGFVEQLRAEPDWRTIPVLVITAKDLTAQERLRLNGWVEQVLQKGAYTRTELFSEVRALVRASVARATSVSTASTTAVQRGSDDDGEDPPG